MNCESYNFAVIPRIANGRPFRCICEPAAFTLSDISNVAKMPALDKVCSL